MIAFKMCLHLIKLQLVLVNFTCSLKIGPNGFTWPITCQELNPTTLHGSTLIFRIGPKPSQELNLVGLKSLLQGPSHRVK
jgi:hypothetical protein